MSPTPPRPGRRAARTSSQLDQRCDERDAKHAGVPLRRVRAGEVRVRSFSTNSRPALRAAACGGRPRAGNDPTVTGEPTSPSPQLVPKQSPAAAGAEVARATTKSRTKRAGPRPASGSLHPPTRVNRERRFRVMLGRRSFEEGLPTVRSPRARLPPHPAGMSLSLIRFGVGDAHSDCPARQHRLPCDISQP